MAGKRVALYARISTSNKGQDVACQLNELRDLATRMGWQTTDFIDEGVSGRKESRPAFDQMMKAVRQRRFDAVCCWRLDRLSRGLRHAVNVLSEFRDLGVEFISVRDGLTFSGPLGLALYALVAALAEAEVEALRERTIAGLKNAKAKGKTLGRPKGTKIDFQRVVELRRQGMSTRAVARSMGIGVGSVVRASKMIH